MGNLSGKCHLLFIKTFSSQLIFVSRYGVQTSQKIYRVSRDSSWSFTFVCHNQDFNHSWLSNLNMNVKTLEMSYKDASRTFFDNFGSWIDLPKEECRDGWNWFNLWKRTPWGDETVRWVRLDIRSVMLTWSCIVLLDQRYSVNVIMDSTCRWLASGACHRWIR